MPATLAATRPSRAVKQRAVALERYLRQIRSPTPVPGPAASIVAELRGDPWIRSQVTPDPAPDVGFAADLSEFVTHGCGFVAKCHADIASMASRAKLDRTRLYTFQAELMLNAAIGAALLRELQPAVDEAVATGDLVAAKGLTQLGHRIRKGVAAARKVLSEAGRRDAEKLVDAMTELPPEEQAPGVAPASQVAREIDGKNQKIRRTARPKKPIVPQIRLPSRTELLAAGLACSLLIWAGTVQLPRYFEAARPVIVVEDFPDRSVLEVVARPPSLYVTLDAATWVSADAAARDAMLAEVVSVPLVDDAYRGALISTHDGIPVAVWTRGGGTRLLEIVEPLAPPGAAEKATLFVP